jgi:hypothetical protein
MLSPGYCSYSQGDKCAGIPSVNAFIATTECLKTDVQLYTLRHIKRQRRHKRSILSMLWTHPPRYTTGYGETHEPQRTARAPAC